MSLTEVYLLAAPPGEEGATAFLETPAGTAVKALCGAAALIIALIGIFRMMSKMGRGSVGQAFQTLIFSLFIAGLLFNLSLTITAANVMSDVTGKLFCSVSKVAGSGDSDCG